MSLEDMDILWQNNQRIMGEMDRQRIDPPDYDECEEYDDEGYDWAEDPDDYYDRNDDPEIWDHNDEILAQQELEDYENADDRYGYREDDE